MKFRKSVISRLIHVYPAEWRREFGAELEELLQHSKFSIPVIINVISGALGERLLDLSRRITIGGQVADQTFGAHYDRMTKIISGAVVVMLMAVPLVAIRSGTVAIIVTLASVMVLALAYAYSPRGFEISKGAFHVKRLIGDVVFSLANLRFVRDATPADFRGCVRLWGSGGLFGYYGLFWTKALGRSRWYLTDRKKALIVTDGSVNVLISPQNRDEFVAAMEHAGVLTSPQSEESSNDGPAFVLTESTGSIQGLPRTVRLVIAGVVAAALLAPVALIFLYAPGRPPVDVTRNSLVIHSPFYGMTIPASNVDVAHVRVVDLQIEPGWKTVLRTNGFGNPHYRAGEFKTANGQTIKLFTTGTNRLVLLPPSGENGMPVLLDTADPDQLVARIRWEWSVR